MNHLANVHRLKNTYFVMRHGQSKANHQGIIISHPDNGLHDDYALTELGQEQAKTSAEQSGLASETIIFASDFSRARETAEIVRNTLGAAPIQLTELLRERSFGEWEKTDHTNYEKVWKFDINDPDHTENNVESINAVLDRTTRLILELEQKFEGKNILLVSHGDSLQILQTGFEKSDATKHTLKHFQTAEIRRLQLT